MDPVGEEIEMPEDRESAGSDRRGPAQWVPKGALSRFLVQGTSWAFVVQILGLTSGIASQVFLARLIPPEALGVYFLLQSIVIVVANVGEFGLNRPLARMVSTDVGAGRVGSALRVVRSAVRISGVAGSVVVIAFVGGAGGWLARHVFESSLMESTVLLVGLWIAGRIVLSISAAVLQGLHRVGLSAMFSGAFSTTVVAAIFGLLLWTGTSCEFDEIIAIATGATVVAALLCVATAWAPFSGVRVAGPPRTGELFSSTLPIFAAGVLQLAAIQADLLIVGVQLDASDVALYGAAKKLTVLVGFPVMVVSYVVPPLIADLYSRGERERLQRMMRTATTATSLPAVGAFVCLLPPVLAPAVQDQHPQHWAIVPEVNAVATLGRTLLGGVQRQDPASVAIPTLPQATVSALKRAGVLAADADPTAPYPLLQPGPGALDTLAERPDAKARGLAPIHRWLRDDQGRPPNVLIVFVESLSTAFTGLDDRSRHAGLMPNLERLAGEMTTVRDFVNVSSPTANGLIASLCAALPSSAVQDIEVGGAVDGDAAYSCISDVLRGFGYRSHFVRGASKVYMACEATLRGHGFDQVIGREDLLRSHGDRPTNAWGFYDDTLMDVLIEEMDRLAKSQQPWLYATLTIGSHLPGYPDPSCEIPARYEDEPLLAGFHCTDRQIGRLVAHLKKTGLWESTVVVITGDHAELPPRKVEELVGRGPLFGSFAPMPLLIHDPLHRLPTQVQTLSGQLDLAPTLLHVLGAPPVEHTFMGWSIFGQRRHHPFIFGRMGRRLAHARSRTASRELPVGSLATLCERGEPLLADDSSPLSACDLDAYLRWLDALWQGHRLFPAERYRGVTGDPNLLRLKWLRYDSKEERQRRKRGEVERRPPPQ